jgi:hypothetical protein
LDELGEKFRDVIPSASLVTLAARSKHIISLEEWIRFFDSHQNVVLESGMFKFFEVFGDECEGTKGILGNVELVWPAQKPMTLA